MFQRRQKGRLRPPLPGSLACCQNLVSAGCACFSDDLGFAPRLGFCSKRSVWAKGTVPGSYPSQALAGQPTLATVTTLPGLGVCTGPALANPTNLDHQAVQSSRTLRGQAPRASGASFRGPLSAAHQPEVSVLWRKEVLSGSRRC